MEHYGTLNGLSEQLDLLYEHVIVIVKSLIQHPNQDYHDAYYQLGNFICSLLFSVKFKIDAFIPEYRLNTNDLNKNYFAILCDDQLIDETNKNDISFLHNTVYELTTQKELLTKCENIYKICIMAVNFLSINENMFDLQFISFIILKRLYFTFPHHRETMEDNLAMILVNLVLFKQQENVKYF
jgi:hypothetical protein